MRRFTLFLSLLVAFVTTTMAQSIDLTFTKVSATDATVTVAGNEIAVDGVTATIAANYDWKALNANSQTFPNASILCPDKNTNAMTAGTGAEGIFTITLNNLPAGYSYKNVTFTSVALNGGGEFQGDDANAQPVNFELTAAGEVVGTVENKLIKVNSAGGESVVVNFEVAEAYPATDGSLELKLKLATTESKGCFYGLIKVSIEAVEEEIPALPTYTVTAEAQDPTMGTATVEVVDGVATFKAVPNEGYKFVDWLLDGEYTGLGAEFVIEVSQNIALVAVFEAIAVEPEPVVELYRLKNDNGYLNVSNYLSHPTGPAGGVNVVAFADSDDQIFTIEDAGNGQVYLKSVSGYYIYCHQWNVDGSADNKTALTFESNGENTFYLKQAGGYFKVENVNVKPVAKIDGVEVEQPAVSGWYPFCDAPKSAAATWSLEKVEETPEPEQPIDFDWTGIFDVTASVTNAMPDLWSCPETFTLKAEYNQDWEMITITEVMGKDIFYLTNGGWKLTVAEDKRSAEISFFSFPYGRIEKYDDYGEIVLRNADTSKNTITLTVNNEGVVSVENLSIGYAAVEGANWMWQMELASLTNVTATKGVEVEPTPQYLEIVSTSPINNAVVNSLDYIQLNFAEEEKASCVATLKPVVLDKDNNVVATLNYGYQNPQGGWLEYYEVGLIFSEPITTPGTYTVKVPAGAIYNNYTKLEIQEIVLTYTVEEPKYLEIKKISPENNSIVEVLDYIELTFDEEVFAIGNAELAVMNVLDKDGNVVTDAAISYYDKYNNELPYHMYSITLSKSITAPGTYTINIPEGAIWDTMEGNIPATTLTYTIEGEPEPEPELPTSYAYYEGTNNHDVRALKSFTIADVDTESSMTVENIQVSGGKSPVYVDKTENVFEVKAGSTLYFEEFDWAGEWMHAYAYIDYNNDFVFDTNLNADGTTGGEVVSYNSFDDKTSWGNAVSGGKVNAGDYEGSKGLPHFILPADLAAGDYRMRIKIDWNRLDANFGDAVENNPKTYGGCQCDIVIRIVGDEEPGVDTAIDNVNVEGEQVIYDITGRRIEKINAAGIYIVNGVKVLVK